MNPDFRGDIEKGVKDFGVIYISTTALKIYDLYIINLQKSTAKKLMDDF